MRKRFVESNPGKYLSKDGKEKWRVINMDLSLLDQHFKGKVPDGDPDLQEAVESVRIHTLPGSKHSDQVKELWKRKGLKWPGSVKESEIPVPFDENEENELFEMALKESLQKHHTSDIAGERPSAAQTRINEPKSEPESKPDSILVDLMNS